MIKRRFRYVSGVDLRVIKKVCEIYNVKMHYLNNSITLINRDEFDNALEKYMGVEIESLKLI